MRTVRGALAKYRLASALGATALLTLDSSIALAQAPTPRVEESRPPDPPPPTLSLFDNQFPLTARSRSALESWFAGADVKCIGCPGATTIQRPEPTNRNTPWVLQGKWQRETPFGAASFGFIGVRNSALPVASVMPLGGDVGNSVLLSPHPSLLMPSMQWSLTAGLEKTLVKFSNGATVGAIADVIVPVKTTAAVMADPRVSGMKSAALRFGIVVRW